MAKRKKNIRLKNCPACKDGVCKTCKGKGKVRIVSGRNKGSTFERHTAKEVSEWTGMEFKRTPMSGGWAKTGDITPKNPKDMVKFPFNLELKNQESWTIPMLMKLEGGKLPKKVAGWWKQCEDDAKKSKRIPLLLMTKANEPVFLMMKTEQFRKLKLHKVVNASMKCGTKRVILWEEFLKIPYAKIVKTLRGKP